MTGEQMRRALARALQELNRGDEVEAARLVVELAARLRADGDIPLIRRTRGWA